MVAPIGRAQPGALPPARSAPSSAADSVPSLRSHAAVVAAGGSPVSRGMPRVATPGKVDAFVLGFMEGSRNAACVPRNPHHRRAGLS